METREIGRTGLRVSVLALGTMNFGYDWHGVGKIDEKRARRLVDMAAEAGVNLLDTADIYGYGAAEKLLKKILRGRRDKFVIASKVLGEMRPGDPSTGGLSRKRITKALNDTLRRLGTDYVDLYMPHAVDRGVPWDETLEAFDRAVTAGKVRVLGCANFMRNDWNLCLDWAKELDRPRFEFNQCQFSLAAPFIETEVAKLCEKEKLGFLAWSPLGGGFLSGKYTGTRRPAGRRKDSEKAFPRIDEARLAGVLEVLKRIAAKEGLSMAQAAIGWIMRKPWVTSVLLGARTEGQLKDLLGARPLSERSVSVLDRLARVVNEAVPAW